MISIHISRQVVGSAVLTELPRGQGKRTEVPLYLARAIAHNGSTHLFGVTRCSSKRVFSARAPKLRYEWDDECPPNLPGLPYHALQVRHAGTGTFALRLYEAGSPHHNSLLGMSPFERTNILIHIGDPACSFGCLTVGGGLTELTKLKRFIEHNSFEGETVSVSIDERDLPR